MLPIIERINSITHNFVVISVAVSFALLVFMIFLNRRYIKTFLFYIDGKTWIILGAIFGAALLIRIFVPGLQHMMYIDEPWYMEAAKSILRTGNQAYYPKSIGWPFILSISFGIFGVSDWVAIYTSVVFGAATTVVLFLLTFAFTCRKDLGLLAALLLALSPLHARWSACAETNVTALFFVVLTVFFCFLYYRQRQSSLLWLSLASLAFTAQIRPESYVFFPLFFIGLLIYGRRILRRIGAKTVLITLFCIMLSLANLAQVMDFQMATNWVESDSGGTMTGNNWSLANLVYNSRHYGTQLFTAEYYPILLVALFLLGWLYLFFYRRKEAYFLATWFCFLWFVYFFSWFQTLGGDERFFMMFFPAIFIVVVCGILSIELLIKSLPFIGSGEDMAKRWITVLTSIIFVISFSLRLVNMRLTNLGPSDNLKLAETAVPGMVKNDIPSDCVVVTVWPTILKSTTDLNVVDLSSFLHDSQMREEVFNNNECVLFFEDMYCFGGGYGAQDDCDSMKNDFYLDVFRRYREANVQYALYLVSKNS